MVEPKYPGAVERYVNMGDCYNKEALWPLRQNIMDCMSGYKGCYQRAYRCLGAAAEIMEDQRSALLTDSLSQKLAKRAHGILAREIPRHKDELPGQVKQRFLGAVSHKGVLCLYDTALAQCGRIYALSDSYGLAHELLIHLLAGAVANGYDVVACPDPMSPDRLSHLLIPQLRLGFLSVVSACPLRTMGIALLSLLGHTISQKTLWSNSYNLSTSSSEMPPWALGTRIVL